MFALEQISYLLTRKIAIEDKVYLKTYYNHHPWSVAVDTTPQKKHTHT
jgi:hypothetical protein